MTNSVRLVEAGMSSCLLLSRNWADAGTDGRERRSIKDSPGQSKIASAAISDPFILLRREDGGITLLKGDTLEGKLVPVESNIVCHRMNRCHGISLSAY